jgi:hypothetical protein
MSEKKNPRIKIKAKWLQGSVVVLKTVLNYDGVEREVTMSFPVEVTQNKEQFKSMLEDAYEQNRPKSVDLSSMIDTVE